MDAETRVKLTMQLKEAEVAYHRIVMGGSVREMVDQNGERITYTAANASVLAGYIRDLKDQLGLLGRRSSNMRFIF